MPLPQALQGRLRVPAIASPMFLVSGPRLVTEVCRAGMIGAFPALNQRTTAGFLDWLQEIREGLSGSDAAPFAVNLVVHRSNRRLEADLAACVANRVPLVITSLGAVEEVVQAIQGYGGLVFHDVINLRHAAKAAAAGVDGIIAVAAGAGGHASTLSPFALVAEIRRIYRGCVILGGAISEGRQIAAARMMGADLAYVGTRFIATQESLAPDGQKAMVLESQAADIVYSAAVSGIHGNFLRQSLLHFGLDPEKTRSASDYDFGTEDAKAWKTLWAAGQGVGSIGDLPAAAELCGRLEREYRDALSDARQWEAAQAG